MTELIQAFDKIGIDYTFTKHSKARKRTFENNDNYQWQYDAEVSCSLGTFYFYEGKFIKAWREQEECPNY